MHDQVYGFQINGAIFEGSFAVEFPMILILALNRLLSIAWPVRARKLCTIQLASVLLILCWAFGAFIAALCLSGQVETIWKISPPGFGFTKGTFIASLLHFIDLYLTEFVVFSSLACYVGIFIIVIMKRKSKGTMQLELPLTLHFGSIFLMTAVVVYLWHNPAGTSDAYGHIFNLINILRCCLPPVFAILTNKTIRKLFFRRKEVKTNVTQVSQWRKETRSNVTHAIQHHCLTEIEVFPALVILDPDPPDLSEVSSLTLCDLVRNALFQLIRENSSALYCVTSRFGNIPLLLPPLAVSTC
ncbi:hypothetical protein Aduo_003841 [Ancylostoma duodenale]